MNPFEKAIAEVRSCIPELILQRAFIDASRYGRNTWRSSVEEQILALVVIPRVMVDCDLIGGTEEFISLDGLPQIVTPETQGGTVIVIPKTRTHQKSITSVMSLRFTDAMAAGSGNATGYGYSPAYMAGANVAQGRTAVMGATAAVMASVDTIPFTATSRLSLIGENTLFVADNQRLPSNCVLQCKLSNHEDMQNLQARYYHAFSLLVVHAVKAYIYNRLILDIATSELHFGKELGKFKEIVDGYADANDNYLDFLRTKWAKITVMNDRRAYMRYIGMQIGSFR